MTITPRERVLMALAHQQPDRIPHHIEFTKGSQRRFETYFNDPQFELRLDNHLATIKALPPGFPREDRPGYLTDDFGTVWDRTTDDTLGVPLPLLPEPALAGYEFPDPRDPQRFAAFPQWCAANADKFRVLKVSHALFERAWAMRGFEQFMMDMALERVFTEELLTKITDYNMEILERSAPFALDAVWFGDDWAHQQGLLIAPQLWRELLKPHLARMFAKVREQNRTVMLHCCGSVESLLGELIEMGLQVFNPFQPEVMDVYAIKKKFGANLTFFGGMSIQQLLPFGTPEQVRRETRRMIDEVGRDGGYILSPAHALPPDVPPENIEAMLAEAHA